MPMISALHVAKYILTKQTKPITTMKLQKLVYYSQAWHLVWKNEPLFHERIEAWTNGPVVHELHRLHRGKYTITTESFPVGDEGKLTDSHREVVDTVLSAYGKLTGAQLSMLTHDEDPWIYARGPIGAAARSTALITLESMHDYYSGLIESEDSVEPEDVEFPAWA